MLHVIQASKTKSTIPSFSHNTTMANFAEMDTSNRIQHQKSDFVYSTVDWALKIKYPSIYPSICPSSTLAISFPCDGFLCADLVTESFLHL